MARIDCCARSKFNSCLPASGVTGRGIDNGDLNPGSGMGSSFITRLTATSSRPEFSSREGKAAET